MAGAADLLTDERTILSACRLVRSEPTITALTVGLAQPEFFGPSELRRFCARVAAAEGVDIEVLEGAQSVRVTRRSDRGARGG